eukprot:TRINITY_DN2987_c0_g2_i2.p1 TRINITY_DN2987_c0_g2~~TRINITY_DN2987_c0_g2_i2.p1  ORF type:complete len:339 (+),score=43.82 TRINITY_DN2987_c0_g2_i2:180-1196(+)
MGKRKGDTSSTGNRVEMRVTGSQGQTLPQIEHGGVTYVVSNPGETFEVYVRHWAHKELTIKMTVDGKCVGYGLCGSPGAWAVFTGFFQGPRTKRAFVFAKPDSTNSIPASSNTATTEGSVGLLEASFYEQVKYACPGATCSHCQFKGHLENTRYKPVIKSAESVAAKEGKNFFLAPSLCVTAGDIHTKNLGQREKIHKRVSGKSLFSARVHCQTAEALVLRKVLDPKKPEHAALLPERLREVFTANPMIRHVAPMTRKRASQPPDMKPSLGESSAPATRNAQPGGIISAEDDEVLVVSAEKRPISVVDLDQMPDLDDDCVILFASGPKKKRGNDILQV